MSKNLHDFWQENFGRSVKVAFYVYRGRFGELLWENIQFFSSLLEHERRNVSFLANKIRQTCQKGNLSVQGNILRRKKFGKIICSFWSLLDFEPNYFKTLTEIFQYGCRSCILRVQWKKLSKNIFFWKRIISFLSVTPKKHLGLRAKKSTGWSYLTSRCPEERFETKNFLERLNFLTIFVHWPENISASRQKHFVRFVKKAFYVS